MLEKLNQLSEPQAESSEEEKKIAEFIQDQINNMPWNQLLDYESTDQSKLIDKFKKSINKQIVFVSVFIKALDCEEVPVLSNMSDMKHFKSKVVHLLCYFRIYSNQRIR